MKVVNFMAGPCSGKSTLSSGLYNHMSENGYNVEFVHEYAKDLTWEERYKCLEDQLYIAAKQNKMLVRLDGKVDWAVADTSLILGLIYKTPDYHSYFEPLLVEIFNSYDNINIFVKRPNFYTEVGRNQTKEEAMVIDNRIRALLDRLGVEYIEVDYNIPHEVLLKIIIENS